MPTNEWAKAHPDAVRGYRRAWYARNSEHAKQKSAARVNEYRSWLRELKAGLACISCGENHPATLDFHHRDPAEKESTIGSLAQKGWSKKRVLAEIAKCDVLCANCHRKVHWEEHEAPI